jgi:hypothetical protein
MLELESASEEMMAHYRANRAEYDSIADALSVPRFSKYCFDELTRIIGNIEAPTLIQAVVRQGHYTDKSDLESMRMAVKKMLLVKYGRRLPRGKRPHPGMVNLVSQITPILIYYGLGCRTYELAPLVSALQFIAEDIGLPGNPRDELRRLKKIQSKHSDLTKSILYEAFIKGFTSKE